MPWTLQFAGTVEGKAPHPDLFALHVCSIGSRHHTQKSHASGFSYVADCQLAILSLRKMPAVHDPSRKPKIMYLDLDLHFSDAVSQAFHNPARGSSTSQVLVRNL